MDIFFSHFGPWFWRAARVTVKNLNNIYYIWSLYISDFEAVSLDGRICMEEWVTM